MGTARLVLHRSRSLLSAAVTAEQPRVILVMCDDLGWGDMDFNGGTVL